MIGIVFGAFDLLHAGHIHFLRECKKRCDTLIVGLHVNPQSERKEKNKPIETLWERAVKLSACRFVDIVTPYEHESEIPLIIKSSNAEIRFLGSDYDGNKPITEPYLIKIEYIDSLPIHTSDLRKRLK